jgi:hypothetical protein
MSISSVVQRGHDPSAWFQANTAQTNSVQSTDTGTSGTQASGTGSGTSSAADASAGSGSSDLVQQLSQDLQAFLLQLQGGDNAASPQGPSAGDDSAAGVTQANAAPPTGDAADEASGTGQAQGHHHHHQHPFGTQETGSPGASQTLAGNNSPAPASEDDDNESSVSSSGASLLAALRAYVSASAPASQAGSLQQTA